MGHVWKFKVAHNHVWSCVHPCISFMLEYLNKAYYQNLNTYPIYYFTRSYLISFKSERVTWQKGNLTKW